jgi:hypothetical protein
MAATGTGLVEGRLAALARRTTGSLVIAVPVFLLCLLVLYPLAAILIQSIFPNLFAFSSNLILNVDSLRTVFTDHASYHTASQRGVVERGYATTHPPRTPPHRQRTPEAVARRS